MNKTDKGKIAESWQSYSMAAGQCSNVLYNLSQSEVNETTKKYAELVRKHDAARNHLISTLKQFGIVKQ